MKNLYHLLLLLSFVLSGCTIDGSIKDMLSNTNTDVPSVNETPITQPTPTPSPLATAPTDPNLLTLINPTQNLSNDATPTIRVSGVGNGLMVHLFTDSSCGLVYLIGSATATQTTVDITTTSLIEANYTIYAQTELAGTYSACSSVNSVFLNYDLDLTPPNNATSLNWAESSPHSSNGTLTANWTKSNSTDLFTQNIQFYKDSSCTTAQGSLVQLNSSSLGASAVTPGIDGSFTYKITSIDQAGNTNTSVCSNSIILDFLPSQILSVTPPANKTYGFGDFLIWTFTFDDTITENWIDNTVLQINIGGQSRLGACYMNSATEFECNYSLLNTELDDLDGISIGSIVVGTSTFRDSFNRDANFNFTSPSHSLVKVIMPATVSLTTNSVEKFETDGSVSLTVELNKSSSSALTVPISFSGSATLNTDYTTSATQLVFAAGETSKTFQINLINDGLTESFERIRIDILKTEHFFLAQKHQMEVILLDSTEVLRGALKIEYGGNHGCALRSDNRMYCWGENGSGKLVANTTQLFYPSPTLVLTDVADMGVGREHNCALKTNGSVWCWGSNSYGQIGNGGSPTYVTSPTQIIASGISKLGVGGEYNCVILTATTELKCWGNNNSKQVGKTPSTQYNSPTSIIASGVRDVSLSKGYAWGYGHTCAILTLNDHLRCWGENSAGQVGIGSTTDQATPATTIASDVRSVQVGNLHTCAIIHSTSELKCWGYDGSGQLGIPSTSNSKTSPVTVIGSNVSKVFLTKEGSFALMSDGSVLSAGNVTSANTNDWTPLFSSSVGVTNIFGFEDQSCFIFSGGHLNCEFKQGIANIGNSVTPIYQTEFTLPYNDMKILESGYIRNNKLYSMNSYNDSNQFISTSLDEILTGVSKASSRTQSNGCAIKTNGKLFCWGDYATRGVNSKTPQELSLSNIIKVATGDNSYCAINSSGALYCWGRNQYGEVGANSNDASLNDPTLIFVDNTVDVSVGIEHTCAIKTGGALYCWGYNNKHQLGDGTTTNQKAPLLIISSGVTQVQVGAAHTCALDSGTAKCWGDDFYGSVGNGATSGNVAAHYSVLSSVDQIMSYERTVCARQADQVKCWGKNDFAQMGNGNYSNAISPTTVWATGVTQLEAVGNRVCAKMTDTTIRCFGQALETRQFVSGLVFIPELSWLN